MAELATPKYSKGLYATRSENFSIHTDVSGVPLDIRYTYGYEFKVMVQYPDLNATFHFLGKRMMHLCTCMDTFDRT